MRVGDIPAAEQKLEMSEEIASACEDNLGLAEVNMTYCYIRTGTGDKYHNHGEFYGGGNGGG